MFCPKCGSLLENQTCSCGFTKTTTLKLKEKPKHKTIEVVDSKNLLAVYDHDCEKCGHKKAELIEKGQMYSDEDDVILYKCGRCGHVEMVDAKVK